TLRKRKARENETPSQRETRLAKQRESRQRKRANESVEEREARLARDNGRKCAKLAVETDEQREKRLNSYRERRTYLMNLAQNQDTINQNLNSQRDNLQHSHLQHPQQIPGQAHSGTDTHDSTIPIDNLSEFERNLLKKFRNKVDKLKHSLCSTCNESFPSIILAKGEC
ncbi:2645_t:CDS:1, partial [Rhizophagus irregularis]